MKWGVRNKTGTKMARNVYMHTCICERIENLIIVSFLIFQHVVKRSHSEACSLNKCTLPYFFYFVFIFYILESKQERLEKKKV